jgi:hypothetical protein
VGAKEGDKQLLRYAEHLADQKAKRQEIKRISLIFITRDFEAVEKSTSSDSAFKFKPTRWFEFYIKLKAHWEKNSDGLAKQLKLFMEENRMSLGNKFRSIDLVAMENFFSAESLMEETLTGEVLLKAQKILGTVTNLKKVHEEMRERNRFTLDSDLNKIFGCLIGYWFPKENPDEPVWVGVDVYAYPGKPEEAALIKAFRDWIKKSNGSWVGMRLDGEWACIRKGKTMQSLIAGDDHVRAVKDHLLQLIEEVEQFKNEYPNLPWLLVPEIGTAAVQPATIQP